jgi:hypothetical protein
MPAALEGGLRDLRVLIPTNRDFYRLVSYAMVMDFEDTVAALSDVDFVSVPLASRRTRLAALARGRPMRPVDPPRSSYDVCLFVAMDPQWLPSLRYVRRLRESADKVVVYLFDTWLGELDVLRRHRSVFSLVDHLFVSFPHALEAYREAVDCPVDYMPQAIDDRWFHPYREERPIDVLSVGRRLVQAHEQVRALARQRDLFYFFTTTQSPNVIDLGESQELLGRIYQSARVHMSWPVEATRPERKGEGSPITARWFESAASGGVVVGDRPRDPEFDRLFPYEGFVREFDPGSPSDTARVIGDALDKIDDRAERLALAEHVRTAHTWKTRWREIVERCGISPPSAGSRG